MKMGLCTLLLASVILPPAHAAARPVYRSPLAGGVQHYRYEVIQTINGSTRKGYRTEFDLDSKGGALFAIVRATSELDNSVWKPVTPDAACRTAMKGTKDTLARVQLYPVNPNGGQKLGSGFLDLCAPPAVFFPLTDILNVALLPMPGAFRASELRTTGETLTYPGFEADYDRAGEQLKETAPGGEMRLVAVSNDSATLGWRPLPADLALEERTMNPPLTMKGTERWAFRVEIDRRSGWIKRASTIYDDLDLKIVGTPDTVPHVRIARNVLIERE